MLVNIGFQVLFHSPPGVLFTFPSQYCSTIGHQVVFRLGGWSPRVPIGFHVSDGTLDTAKLLSRFEYETFTLFGWPFQVILLRSILLCHGPYPINISVMVWPLPLSLATTRGISFDFSSSRYLDVSVPGVPLVKLCIHLTIPFGVFPHSEICGSKLICSSPQLIAACHVLHRLLMPRHSPLCSCSLELPYWFFSACSLELLSFFKQIFRSKKAFLSFLRFHLSVKL